MMPEDLTILKELRRSCVLTDQERDALSRAISELEACQWVKVEDRLPEVGQAVWVTHRVRGDVRARTFDKPYDADEFRDMFSAWMPRQTEPAPFQEGQ